jgi:truncated hemoglobin YjbI
MYAWGLLRWRYRSEINYLIMHTQQDAIHHRIHDSWLQVMQTACDNIQYRIPLADGLRTETRNGSNHK